MSGMTRLVGAIALTSTLISCNGNKPDSAKAAPEVPNTTPAVPDHAEQPTPPDAIDKTVTPQIVIPAGTKFHIVLSDGLSTTKNRVGDRFSANLVQPVVVNGQTILNERTKVRGRVTDIARSGRIKGRANIRLLLTAVFHNGQEIAIATKPFVAVAQGTKKRDGAIIGAGTGFGALIGGLAGGGKGAAIGAAVGAGGGTGTVLATRGKELQYPPETRMTFTLAAPLVL